MPACLLDKNLVRRAVEGIGKAQIGQPLTDEQRASLELLLAAEQGELTLFISLRGCGVCTCRLDLVSCLCYTSS